MKRLRPCLLLLCALIVGTLLLGGCAQRQREIFETSESQLALRSMQTRVFDTDDKNTMLRTVIATLQDLGFVVNEADADLGTVTATKRSGYALKVTVSVRPKGKTQMIVRASAQYNIYIVEDPEPYQKFFAALSKAAFLEANQIE